MSLVLKMRTQTANALVPLLVDEVLERHVSADGMVNPRALALARAIESGMTVGAHKARLVLPDRLHLVDALIDALDAAWFLLPHANHKKATRRLLEETRAFRASAVDKLAQVFG